MTLGIGAIIGAGIFVLTGSAAALYAGPAIMLSYVLAGIGCVFAGLCYAEFASMIPIAGLGIHLWLRDAWRNCRVDHRLGFDSGICVWRGDSCQRLEQHAGGVLAGLRNQFAAADLRCAGRAVGFLSRADGHHCYPGVSPPRNWPRLPHATAHFNLLAFLAMLGSYTLILIVGIKESANFNSGVVFVKLVAVFTFIARRRSRLFFKHPHMAHANWSVFHSARIPGALGHLAGQAFCGVPVWFSSLISDLTRFLPRPRRPASRRKICLSAFWVRWLFAPSFTSLFADC